MKTIDSLTLSFSLRTLTRFRFERFLLTVLEGDSESARTPASSTSVTPSAASGLSLADDASGRIGDA